MSDPALLLNALLEGVKVPAMPRLSLADAERHLAGLVQSNSIAPLSITPLSITPLSITPLSITPALPSVTPPPIDGGAIKDEAWSAPPIELTSELRVYESLEWAEVDPETAAPHIMLPEAPSIAPPRMAPPPLNASHGAPPQLIIISEPPPDSMFSLADLEEDERGAGASISEIISPATPPPLPNDSISEAIAEAAERVRSNRDDVIDLDASSIELVFIDDASSSKH